MLLIVLFQKQTELRSIYLKEGRLTNKSSGLAAAAPPPPPLCYRLFSATAIAIATAAATRQLKRKKKQRIVRGSRCFSATCSGGKGANLSCDCVCTAPSPAGGGASIFAASHWCGRSPSLGAPDTARGVVIQHLPRKRDEDREIEKILNRWPPYLQGRGAARADRGADVERELQEASQLRWAPLGQHGATPAGGGASSLCGRAADAPRTPRAARTQRWLYKGCQPADMSVCSRSSALAPESVGGWGAERAQIGT